MFGISPAQAQEAEPAESERLGPEGRVLSPAEESASDNYYSAQRELRDVDPNNPQLSTLSSPEWVPTEADAARMQEAVADARAKAAENQANQTCSAANPRGGPATVGQATSNNYRNNFFKANPDVDPNNTVVHHAVEQQVLRNYPGTFTPSEINSPENLRGIPSDENSDMHLSQIRRSWNGFYDQNPAGPSGPSQQDFLDHATTIDNQFGTRFTPPVR